MTVLFQAIVFVLVSQASLDHVVRIGKLTESLTDKDVTAIDRLAHDNCGKLWTVERHSRDFVYAYCAAEFERGRLRKGKVLTVVRARQDPWIVRARSGYAQVGVGARALDRPPAGERDPGRPFVLNAALSDAELLDVVAFVRTRPKAPKAFEHGTQVEKDWPIGLISRGSRGALTVWLRRNETSGQSVEVRKASRGWEVVSVRYYID